MSYDSFMPDAAKNDPPDENARYKRTIRAAEEMFKRVGFRAVTMEMVAREANIAKATLYTYFKNKDELFIAVSARMARILRGGVEQALATPDASLDERLTEAVISKHRLIFTLVRKSAHAAELFSYTHAMAGDIFCELDAAILRLLSDAMANDPQFAPNADQLARALYFGSGQLASRCESVAAMEAELRSFSAIHLAGARALASRGPPRQRELTN
jgi:AcrR family transcriptional regulator